MKLPQLLSQYLYQYKILRLPGIGIFTLDPQAVIPEFTEKDLPNLATGIEFDYKPVHEADNELVEFIKSHTGKMKALAAADLESYLALGTQLLNIGKPFYLEGIGALTKTMDGRFEFTRGEYSTARIDDTKTEKKKPAFEESNYEYSSGSGSSRKLLLLLLVIIGLVIAGGGGYLLYKKNTYAEPEKETVRIIPNDTPVTKPDTSKTVMIKHDSLPPAPVDSISQSHLASDSNYKFVILETNNKFRALKRYNQLLSFNLKIKLYQKDSEYFKLYFSFPALARDTTRIKDSLDNFYATKTIIER